MAGPRSASRRVDDAELDDGVAGRLVQHPDASVLEERHAAVGEGTRKGQAGAGPRAAIIVRESQRAVGALGAGGIKEGDSTVIQSKQAALADGIGQGGVFGGLAPRLAGVFRPRNLAQAGPAPPAARIQVKASARGLGHLDFVQLDRFGLRHFLAALPGGSSVVAGGDPVEEVLLRVLGVEGYDQSASLGARLELDTDAGSGSGGDGFGGLQRRGDIGRLAPRHAVVVGGDEARAIALGVGGADGQAAELMSAGRESLIEKKDAARFGFLDEARVVATVVPLFVGDAWFGPGGSFVFRDRDYQVVAGLVGGLVAAFGDGEQCAFLRTQ